PRRRRAERPPLPDRPDPCLRRAPRRARQGARALRVRRRARLDGRRRADPPDGARARLRCPSPRHAAAAVDAHTRNVMGTGDGVFNQPPPLEDYNVYGADALLREAVEREGAGWAAALRRDVG